MNLGTKNIQINLHLKIYISPTNVFLWDADIGLTNVFLWDRDISMYSYGTEILKCILMGQRYLNVFLWDRDI
jgi:hypothetical protein